MHALLNLNSFNSDSLMQTWKDQLSVFCDPSRKLNLYLVDQLAEMTDQQLKSLENYGLLALGQLKKAAEIRDEESAHRFGLSQADFYSELSRKALQDARELSQRNLELAREVGQLLSQSQQLTAK